MKRIDEKDLKILKILMENSRTPVKKMAEALNISDVAVNKRIKKLESLGVIKRYTIDVDIKKLGYNVVSITGIDVAPESIFSVAEYLKDLENVKYLALTSGDHPIMAIIFGKDNSELAKIHEEISKKEGVKRVCPSIILDVLKEDFPKL